MSKQNTPKEFAPSDESMKRASSHIIKALEHVALLVDRENKHCSIRRDDPQSALGSPVLVGVHALITSFDDKGGRIANALEEIAKSLDFIAARPDDNEASEVPTEHEREVMYQALKADYWKRVGEDGSLCVIADGGMTELAALRHFKKITGR
jgi:hypothetical protein